jgi:hypothetical protein
MSPYIRRSIYLFAFAGLLLTCGCSSDGGRMRQRLRSLAGPGAIDCGNSLFPNLVPKNNACAIGATVEHAPFYIRWEIRDHALSTMRGVAMTHTGQIFVVTETLGTPAGELEMTPCDSPNLVPDISVTSVSTLTCAPAGAERPQPLNP